MSEPREEGAAVSIHSRQRARIGLAVLLVVAAAGTGALDLRHAREAEAVEGTTVVCANGSGTRGTADTTAFDLEVTEGYVTMPDGNSVYMWSYSSAGAGFQAPGAVLCVDQGDTVTVNLAVPDGFPNLLPPASAYDTPVSVVFPGQAGVAAAGGSPGLLTNEVIGGTVTYTFTAAEPGTYLYESGTAPESQVQMGLYGGLLVYPTDGSVSAYGSGTGTDYEPDREYLLVLHEIDPDYHTAIEQNIAATPPDYVPGSFLGQPDPAGTLYHYRYWTINGRAMPDTLAANFAPWLPNQPFGSLIQVEPGETALVRYAKRGPRESPVPPARQPLRLVAQDGRLLADAGAALSFEAFTKTVAAGQTFDLLAHWDPVEGYDPDTNQIPVTIPSLQNLVFMDDATYYSGSPYLGEEGPLPTGVTSSAPAASTTSPGTATRCSSSRTSTRASAGWRPSARRPTRRLSVAARPAVADPWEGR